MNDSKLFLLIAFPILAGFGLLIGSMTYLEGAAKADWIRHTRGIELPWYRAVFLRVEVTTIDAQVSAKP
jgi:hypothetical protein